MNTDNNLIIFKAIANFTQALADEFGKKQHSLALYSRLINKTTLAHDTPIKKHISVFTEFCINNREAILNKKLISLTTGLKYISSLGAFIPKHSFTITLSTVAY